MRIASAILNIIAPDPDQSFCDLCCGCGAVSIELVNRGYAPENITMLDKGPWGRFWEAVGRGTFNLDLFEKYCREMPEPAGIQAYLRKLADRFSNWDTNEVFLLLQAGAFGGKAVWIEGGYWKTPGFRSYWLPTAASKRRSHTNPMMPMPDTLFARVKAICEGMVGVRGLCCDIKDFWPMGTVYIDPPYAGSTGYGHTFDVLEYARQIKPAGCYVSEGRPLSDTFWPIVSGRRKGGISGLRKVADYEEWLSLL